jgi:sarcosine oxidase subunit alpha
MKVMRIAPGNLGEIKPLGEKPRFEQVNLTPELLVVGAGLAGLEAALLGAKAGVRVVLVEAEPWLGGFETFQGEENMHHIEKLTDQFQGLDNLKILTSTTAAASYPDGLVFCVRSCRPDEPFYEVSYLIRPKKVVVATGAMDRPLIFNHNDRPGVMLPQTAHRFIHHYGLKPGNRVLVAGGDEYIYKVALDLAENGVEVVALVDSRQHGFPEEFQARLVKAGIDFMPGHTIIQAEGKKIVSGVHVTKLDGSARTSFPIDAIIASCGRTPLFKLLAQTGTNMEFHPGLGFHLPRKQAPGYQGAGRVMGLEDRGAIRAQGRLEDIDTAMAEGFDHTEMIKRYTTATMGPEQGALSQANFLDYLAQKMPDQLSAQTITTPRPPLVGLSMGSLAAGLHDQPKLTPLHHIQIEQGGKPMRAGPWIRIEDFGDPEKESMAVRNAAGICDVSTLGKFRIFGPDAEKLLNLINLRGVDGLKDDKILYTAACNEEGVCIDDGIVIKLGEHDYYFTTSTEGMVPPLVS